MIDSILYFGRSSCNFSKKIHLLLKSNFKKVHYFESTTQNEKFKFKDIGKVDYIFSFRNLYILKKNLLNKVNNFAINFHPGIPRYRGIGCLNFALYENSKEYGSTAHIMTSKIDGGKILNVKKFAINKNDKVEKVLKKTHKIMFIQAKEIINKIITDENYITKIIEDNNTITWSKKLYKRKKLNKMRLISKNISSKELKKRIRAFTYKDYKIHIKIHNKIFRIHD